MYVPNEARRILFSEAQLSERIKQIGKKLTEKYSGKNPLFICVLKGASPFFCDLIRAVECPLEIGFIRASSYRGTESGELFVEETDIPDIKGRSVVLVDDIADTAKTLSKIKELYLKSSPASVETAVLIDKPSRRVVKDFKPDYAGFEIEDLFIVGFGMDCGEKYRNLPYIAVYEPTR